MRTLILSFFLFLIPHLQSQSIQMTYTKSFGFIHSGTVDSTSFALYNHSDQSVWLTGWRSGCGCVSLYIVENEIRPKSYGKVIFIYNSSGNTGKISRFAKIGIRGAEKADSITLQISGFVTKNEQQRDNIQKAYSSCVVFDSIFYHLPPLIEGENTEQVYRFKNTGVLPVSITHSTSSCGCTVPSYSKEPVMPGKYGVVKFHFNTSGKGGMYSKNIQVYFDNGQMFTLTIQGIIVEKFIPIVFSSQFLHPDPVGNWDTIRAEFRFINKANTSMRITEIRKLGDTRAIYKKTIDPGESASIVFLVSTGNYTYSYPRNYKEWYEVVFTDGKKEYTYELSFSGIIKN